MGEAVVLMSSTISLAKKQSIQCLHALSDVEEVQHGGPAAGHGVRRLGAVATILKLHLDEIPGMEEGFYDRARDLAPDAIVILLEYDSCAFLDDPAIVGIKVESLDSRGFADFFKQVRGLDRA
jgi:hypothetical protein